MLQQAHLLFVISFAFVGSATVLSKNPVFSVIFLVLAFCNASALIVFLNAELLAALFVIVYVGAIAILFLFIVMMLDVKVYPVSLPAYFFMLPIINLVFIGFASDSRIMLNEIWVEQGLLCSNFESFDFKDNLSVYGQVLYNGYAICFLLGGLVLLVSMVGAVVLTLNFKSRKAAMSFFKQLSKGGVVTSYFT
jgi:NADH-quinone oxidoreductase subunit J